MTSDLQQVALDARAAVLDGYSDYASPPIRGDAWEPIIDSIDALCEAYRALGRAEAMEAGDDLALLVFEQIPSLEGVHTRQCEDDVDECYCSCPMLTVWERLKEGAEDYERTRPEPFPVTAEPATYGRGEA